MIAILRKIAQMKNINTYYTIEFIERRLKILPHSKSKYFNCHFSHKQTQKYEFGVFLMINKQYY